MTAREPDAADAIFRLLRPQVTPDRGEPLENLILTEYGCSECQERCINPEGSMLAEAGVCLQCHICYAVHGHVRKRISGRWENRRPEPTEERSPTVAVGGLGPSPATEAESAHEVYHVTANHSSRTLHAHQHCRFLGAAAAVVTSSTTNLPNRAEACSLCWPDGTTVEDIRDEPGDADG